MLTILTVVSTNDSGAGSLRAAIFDALPADTIRFDNSLAGQTINLTSGVLAISKPLTIQGLGAGQLTVDGKYNGLALPEGVFFVDSTVTASISDLTISRGFASSLGGGIYNAGNLTVTNCTLSGNTAGSSGGGIYFDGTYGGTIAVSGCTFSGNNGLTWGGGIGYVGPGGTLTVTNSTFSGNGAARGGGIFAQRGTTTITNSTFAGSSTAGGIAISHGTITISGTTIAGNDGSGISNDLGGTVTVIDSTISANGDDAYQGGGIYNDGTLIVQNSTIARNSASGAGAGIYRESGTVTLVNTIVAQNANGISPDIFGAVTANFSLIGNTAGATISGTGNLLNQDPLLAWLGNYGGPTQTMPLLVGSPAIDTGSNDLIPSGLIADQRGLYRIVNGTVDIGACENQPPTQDALIRQVRRLSLPAFDGTGDDLTLALGGVYSGQQVQVFVGQTLDDLRPVGTFTNTAGDLPWMFSIDIHTANLAVAAYVAVTSDKPLTILSVVVLHPNFSDLAGYQEFPVVASVQPEFQEEDYSHVAKLFRWDWSQSDFVPLPEADWSNPSVIDWSKQTVILTHGWNGSLIDAERKSKFSEFIWSFAEDFMVGRTLAQDEQYNLLAIDWYDGGSSRGSDPNNKAPAIEVNLGDARDSSENGIKAAKVLAELLITAVGAVRLHPEQMMLIGHSNGAGFMASMALTLGKALGKNVAELVALDAPFLTSALDEVRSAVAEGIRTSNYYMPLSARGFGWPLFVSGQDIFNFKLDGDASKADGVFDIGHGIVAKRYAKTADDLNNHDYPWGFQESAFVNGGETPYDGFPFWSETLVPGVFVPVSLPELSAEDVVTLTQKAWDTVKKTTRSIWDAGVRVAENVAESLKGLNTTLLKFGDLLNIHGLAHSAVYGSIDVNIPEDADLLEFKLSVMDSGNHDRLLVAIGDDVLHEIDLAQVQSTGGRKAQLWMREHAGESTTVTFYMPSEEPSSDEFLISDIQFVDVNFPPLASADPDSVVVDASTATFAVTYTDADDSVLFSTIDGDDILVTGPNGFSQLAALVSIDQPGDGSPRTAIYRITAPDGAWDSGDNGTYTVSMQVNQVSDTSVNYVLSGALGTFTVNVAPPVNQAPSFTSGANQTVLEDTGWQAVVGWATAISGGPPSESAQALNFIVTNNNNALFSVQPLIGANGTLTYTPATNANGTATVSVAIHDNGGTANGGVDTSAMQTFTITVTAVNDVPSFTSGANQTVLEDATPQTIAGWATAISAGPANESGQALNFLVTNNNNALFSVQPSMAVNGALTYTPAATAFGTATVSVTLHDNGGTANDGQDTSATKTFTITITAVNDVPSFTKGANQTINENAGAQTVANWATAISAGPPNEAGQLLNFIVSSTNPSLFSVAPAINPSGTLTYTPATNASGSATVTVQLHDNGGTANGGEDTSAAQTFTITVTGVEHPWQNSALPEDVTGDGNIRAADALLVINSLLRHGSRTLPLPWAAAPPYLDVSGDGRCTPTDALLVINWLLTHPNGSQGAAQTAAQGDPLAGALVGSSKPADQGPSPTSSSPVVARVSASLPIAFAIIVSGDVSRIAGDSAATQAAVPVASSLVDGPTVALRTAGARRAPSATTLAEAMSNRDIGSEPARATTSCIDQLLDELTFDEPAIADPAWESTLAEVACARSARST